jgi:hypothetical protein
VQPFTFFISYRRQDTAPIAMLVVLQILGLNAAILSTFAPDLALLVTVALALLCLPAAWRVWTSARRSLLRHRGFR